MLEIEKASLTPLPAPTVDYAVSVAVTAKGLSDESHAESTRVSYASAWKIFTKWCADTGAVPMPAREELLIAYVAHLEHRGVSHSTVVRHLSAIRWMHDDKGAELITGKPLAKVVRGHARRHGRAAAVKAAGLRTEAIARVVAAIGTERPKDVRDRALILVGFAGGFRRSELADVDVRDVADHDDGLRILVRRSKADQEGKGHYKGIPYGARVETCPVTALRRWIDLAGVTSGPLFRRIHQTGIVSEDGISGARVAEIVKARALAAGMDPKKRWAGHSLRRGFATEAAARGVPRHQVMADGGWLSAAVDEYYEAGESMKDKTAARLGL